MNRVVYQYYTLKMRKRKGGNLQISSTMVFFPLYFIMDSGYTNEVSVYKLYLLGVNLSVIGRVLGQAFLRTTSPSRLRRATADCQSSATPVKKISAGVFQSRHFLGRLFNKAITLSRSSSEITRKSQPFGKKKRSRPFVFSFVPLCHGA